MTSTDINYVLVKDERLISNDVINYAVVQGAQSATTHEENATTASSTQHQFTIQVPSLETVVDRKIYWKSTAILKITTPAPVAINTFNLSYGETDALAPFPLTSLCTTMSVKLNNNTITTDIKDIMPCLLRSNSSTAFNVYNDGCPVLYDNYLNYEDGLFIVDNVLGGYNNSLVGLDVKGRGSFPVGFYMDANCGTQVQWDAPGNFPNNTFYVKFTSCEPLFMSPFLFGDPKSNNAGLYGLNNMIFNFTLGDTNRLWRKAPVNLSAAVPALLTFPATQMPGAVEPAAPFVVSIEKFEESKLIMQFLTPKPSQLLAPKCKLPFYSLDKYITQSNANSLLEIAKNATNNYKDNTPKNFTTNSLTIATIPDRFFIFQRKPIGKQNMFDSDSFTKINNIQINFANSAGLLSTSFVNSLYTFSKESGSNQSFDEFNGVGSKYASNSAGGSLMPMSGSFVILESGIHIPLASDYYAPSSIGNFTVQFVINAATQQTFNYLDSARNAAQVVRPAWKTLPREVETVLICQQSGILSLERGTSSIDQGLCSKEIVLATVETEPYSKSDVRRLIGSGFSDNLKSMATNALGALAKKLPSLARQGLESTKFENPVGETVRRASVGALKNLGYGKKSKLAALSM